MKSAIKIFMLFWCLWLGVCTPTWAQTNTQDTVVTTTKANFSPIFIKLSDAMGQVRADKAQEAIPLLQSAYDEFNALQIGDSPLKDKAQTAFKEAIATPNNHTLSVLSVALYDLEKQQNPTDYTAKRAKFAKNITPALDKLTKAVHNFEQDGDIDKLKVAYDGFNRAWVSGERVVRNTSMAHYGKIETAMALMRVGIESTPPNLTSIKDNLDKLSIAIDSYNRGETITQTVQDVDLAYGIELLQAGLDAFKNNNHATASAKLGAFIDAWVVFEGQVSTRNPALYSKVESQIPIIMATGDKKAQQDLQTIIDELSAINPTSSYTAIDSMLILLREGLEALLIIMALVAALTAANQPKGKKWVYAGVGVGLVASVAGAIILQKLFPAMTSGANREALEGVVGIVAVVMMLGVGVWLHSKSSVKAWNAYIDSYMGRALSTGSFVGLFGLSFLSVFREGAETILFYAGILPNISTADFLLGVAMALLILAVVAFIMVKTSLKLPIPKLFLVLTWLIYGLGFKILGVSISALQLTGQLPYTIVPNVPTMTWLGFYPTVQGMITQGLYVLVIVVLWAIKRTKDKHRFF